MGDFPSVDKYRAVLSDMTSPLTEFRKLDKSMIREMDKVMTFDIPLNDTSSAGLGITLKGKTTIIDGKSIDLGIFVKSILTGGAASRVNSLKSRFILHVYYDIYTAELITMTTMYAFSYI